MAESNEFSALMGGEPKAISLDPPKVEGPVRLDNEPGTLRPTENVESRADKADYALGEDSPGVDVLKQDYWTGGEARVRDQAATTAALNERRQKGAIVSQMIRAAAAEGRPLTAEEQQTVYSLPVTQIGNPKTALEKLYAKRSVDEAIRLDSEESPEDDPAVAPVADLSEQYLAKQQIAQRIFEDVRQRYDESSWASWAADTAKTLFPGYSEIKRHGAIPDTGAESLFSGSNLGEQIQGLYFSDPDTFEADLQKAVDEMAADNLPLAVELAQAAVSYSTTDAAMNNLFDIIDVADVATLGGASLAKGLGKGARAAVRSRALLREAADPAMTSVDRKVATGKFEDAVAEATDKKLSKAGVTELPVTPTVTRPERQVEELYHQGMGLQDPSVYTRRAGSFTNEQVSRLEESLANNRALLKSSTTDVTHLSRIDTPQAKAAMIARAKKDWLVDNSKLEDTVVDMIPVHEQEKVFGGTDYIEILMGDKDAAPFSRPDAANTYAKKYMRLPEGGYTIKERKGNYFIRVEKNMDETDLGVLDARIGTDNRSVENWKNTWIGAIRNPDDLLSAAHRGSRKVATYGANSVMTRMSEVAKSIGQLGKNESRRVSDIIDEARFKKRTVIDTDGKKVRVSGVFYKDIQELQEAYMKKYNSLPTEKEAEAYFSFRQLMDYDHLVRNVSVKRDKERLGISRKSVGLVHTDESGKKMYKQTDFFEAKNVDSLPSQSGEPFTVAWYNDTGKTSFGLSSKMFKRDFDTIDELITKKNYRVLQVADPRDKALRDVVKSGGEPIQYLVVRDIKDKPLSDLQVPYNEGGHWIYPTAGKYLKQAQTHKTKFGRRIYSGDVTAHYFLADGEKYLDAYETARKMMLNEDPGLDDFIAKNLPYKNSKKFKKLFRGEGNKDAPFDRHTPFVLTSSGQRTTDVRRLEDIFGDQIVDAGNSEHSVMSKLNTQYAQERGERLTSIRQSGTEANPIFKMTGAPVMDPMKSLGRSTAQLAKSQFFDDLKHKSIEDYVTQFADVIDVPIQKLRADPMSFLRKPSWKDDVPVEKLSAAKNARRAILHILNEDTPDARVWKSTRQKIVDSILKVSGKDSTLVDPWKWDINTDPSTIARSAVFHAKLGLWNPVQFPLQASGALWSVALDGNPIRATRAAFLNWSMRMRGLAPGEGKAQSFLGRAASKALGIPKEQVDEMYQMYKNSGFSVIEGEFSNLDDYLNPKMLYQKTGLARALKTNTFFFKEGNQVHKGTAFALSYLRFRDANPLLKIGAKEQREILDRADLYYGNMSRASNNPLLQQGVQSIPTQFFAYQTRMSEAMLGKRLTGAEKARVMAMYSAMYGIPVGVGGTTLGAFWPIHESIREAAQEQGIDVNNDFIQAVIEGAGSVALEHLSGEEYNVAERIGPAGLSWGKDLMDGKFLDVLGGASASFMGEMISKTEPFLGSLVGVFSGDEDSWPLAASTFQDVLKEASSWSSSARAYYAYTTGQYLTRDGSNVADLGDVTEVQAGLMAATGLTPIEVSDTYLKIDSVQKTREVKKELEKEAMKYFILGTKASADKDAKSARAYYSKAKAILDGGQFTAQERQSAWRNAMRQNTPLLERIDRSFMLVDPEKRRDRYIQRRLNGE